jgi:hypothetical protein
MAVVMNNPVTPTGAVERGRERLTGLFIRAYPSTVRVRVSF